MLSAPTRCAAHNIKEQSLHSLLHLSASRTDDGVVSLRTRQKLQSKFELIYYMIIAKKSMIGLKMLELVYSRLRAAKLSQDNAFLGGLLMLLVVGAARSRR